MHTVNFSLAEAEGRALDRLMRSMEPGDVEAIRTGDGRLVVVLRPLWKEARPETPVAASR